MSKRLLVIRDLHVDYIVRGEVIKAVRGVSLELDFGETLCIVGESGSGKTTLAMAIAGTLPPNAIIRSGEIILNGVNILHDKRYSRKFVSMIPQEVGSALSPFHTVEQVFIDVLMSKGVFDREEALKVARFTLNLVGFNDINRVLKSYPHELSGGMLQRVLIALAISRKPLVLIADEPTSMIDASLKRDVVDLLKNIVLTQKVSMIVVTHDIALAPHLCSKIAIMYSGEIIEDGLTEEVLANPMHPYTMMLLESIPRILSPRKLKAIPGLPPDPRSTLTGCSFEPRCPKAIKGLCDKIKPPLTTIESTRRVSCHLTQGKEVTLDEDSSS
jgi:oligopeptide/dipeptide ABC transporter ATP-binding protein